MSYRRNPAVTAATFADETTLLEPASGRFFGLEEVGARIWALLESTGELEQLVARLTSEYDIDPQTCRTDVRDLLEVLVDRGLVERA